MERLTVPNEAKFCRHLQKGVPQWEGIDRLAEYEDKVESGELIQKDKVMEKIETIIDELVEIGFMDSQCQVKDCHKSDKIQCGDGVCTEENQKIWKAKILEALK